MNSQLQQERNQGDWGKSVNSPASPCVLKYPKVKPRRGLRIFRPSGVGVPGGSNKICVPSAKGYADQAAAGH